MLFSNDRPVSLMSVCCKVFEHAKNNGLICRQQPGWEMKINYPKTTYTHITEKRSTIYLQH